MIDFKKKFSAFKTDKTIIIQNNIIVISEIASIESCGIKSKIKGYDFDLYTYNISLRNGHIIKNILCISTPQELYDFIFI